MLLRRFASHRKNIGRLLSKLHQLVTNVSFVAFNLSS